MDAYRPLFRLGVGRLSEIYLGLMLGAEGFQRVVVLKKAVLGRREAEARASLIAEARLVGALQHPNIVQVHSLTESPTEGLMLVVEYLPGISVHSLLEAMTGRGVRIPWAIACRIIADAARGLDHAHRATDHESVPLGIVHRDMTPRHLLVTEEGITKIVDFAIAYGQPTEGVRKKTAPGYFKGTPEYCSPEQIRGRPIDAQSDVFSLGVVLHELLEGRPLFRGDDHQQTFEAILKGPPPPAPSVGPRVVADLSSSMLARKREDRVVTMGEVADVLESAVLDARNDAWCSHASLRVWLAAEMGASLRRRRERIRMLVAGGESVPTDFEHEGHVLATIEAALDSEVFDTDNSDFESEGDTRVDIDTNT